MPPPIWSSHMTKLPLKFITLCTLATSMAAFAQEEPVQQDNPQQPVYQYQQAAPQQPVYQQAAPQQPVYYAVPQNSQNVQYVSMPPAQAPQQNQAMYAPAQPQQGSVVPPKQRKSKVSFFMGIDMNFYLSSMTYETDEEYKYDSDLHAEHTFDGKGVNAGAAVGLLIKDIIGIRGFFGLGKQSGQSSYRSSDISCPAESCSDIDADVTNIALGASTTFFPFNRSLGPMYNSYIEGAVGISIHLYDDDYDYADRFERDGSILTFFKMEVGKLVPLNEFFNVGFGIAYSLDIASEMYSDSDEDIDRGEFKHSLWVGVRFARKTNKTEAANN